jgi:hypothetical protein
MRQDMSLETLQAVARHSDLIRTGKLSPAQLSQLVRTGACGAPQATQLQSWGSACPTGFCPPEGLPAALNRYFAGDRTGCRELPFGIVFTAAAAGVVTVADNSPVTACPTRLIAVPHKDGGLANWTINVIQFGIRNQLVGGPAPALAFAPDAIQLVPMVPDCLRAGQPYTITVERTDADIGADSLTLIFIGPVVG